MFQGVDYTLSYSGDLVNVTADGVTVTVTGTGNFSGEKKLTFRIVPASIGNAVIGGIADQTYTGSEIRLEVTVTYNGKVLEADMDYEVRYSGDLLNVTEAGVTVTVTGKGNYTGTRSPSHQHPTPRCTTAHR